MKLQNSWKLLVNTISPGRNDRHSLYLVYGFIILRGRTVWFLVEVRGHARSAEVKNQNIENIVSQCRKGG